jgi:hypothetical protein
MESFKNFSLNVFHLKTALAAAKAAACERTDKVLE